MMILRFFLALCLGLAEPGSLVWAKSSLREQRPKTPLKYIATFHSSIPSPASSLSALAVSLGLEADLTREIRRELGVKTASFVANVELSPPPTARSSSIFRGIIPSLELTSDPGVIVELSFDTADDARRLIKKWRRQGLVVSIEAQRWSHLTYQPRRELATAKMWWHDELHWPRAWELAHARGDLAEPVVAVLDSGFDLDHPLLRKRLWQAPGGLSPWFCPGGRHGCNTTKPQRGLLGSGELAPHGWDAEREFCPYGVYGGCVHGTHVAGLIAAEAHEYGVGLCPQCRLMLLKVVEDVDGQALISDAAILRALKYVSLFRQANDRPLVRVINMSFGKYHPSRAVSLFLSQLQSQDYGPLVVAAAGNDDVQRELFPAALPSVISVSALNQARSKASYSNFGSWVDIASPGGDGAYGIWSTVPGGFVDTSQGTSVASPIVAAAAGFILSTQDDMTTSELRRRLLLGADTSIYQNSAVEWEQHVGRRSLKLLGHGILNIANAIGIVGENQEHEEEKRVKPMCSSTPSSGNPHSSTMWFCLLMALPLLIIFAPRPKRKA